MYQLMEIGSREWQNFIIDGAQKLGIEIDAGMTIQFSIHAAELIRWNRKLNLTAITDPEDLAAKHFLDSLAPAHLIPDNARMLDIGSGGGFPGIPLKILNPSLKVMLIDGTRKKVNFLKHALRTLKLESIEAHQIRAENLSEDPAYVNLFDVIISRALSSLKRFVSMALPLLATHGSILAMKGEVNQKELDAVNLDGPEERCHLEVKNYKLPSIRAARSLVIIRRLH
ncbi:MAG: 16S rRNA (guanine(527)-N(7))-methyltransferase RsmG [Desulfobacterales bacterium]